MGLFESKKTSPDYLKEISRESKKLLFVAWVMTVSRPPLDRDETG